MNRERQFYGYCISTALKCINKNKFNDNVDLQRFNQGEKVPDFDSTVNESAYWFDWFAVNRSRLFEVWLNLADAESRKMYLAVLIYRLAGHTAFRIPVLYKNSEIKEYKNIEQPTDSDISLSGRFGEVKYFNFNFNNRHYQGHFHPFGLEYYLVRNQYFYKTESIDLTPKTGNVVIDGGACLGDSSVVFAQSVGKTGKVFAFDPMDHHCKMIKENACYPQNSRIKVVPLGLSNICQEGDSPRADHYSPGYRVDHSENIPLITLDKYKESKVKTKIDFVKLDVEGEEARVIEGMADTIRDDKPVLALSVYHKPDDLFCILDQVKKIRNDYKFYFGHYTIHNEESVLYCA